jgi:hypothetical protein
MGVPGAATEAPAAGYDAPYVVAVFLPVNLFRVSFVTFCEN